MTYVVLITLSQSKYFFQTFLSKNIEYSTNSLFLNNYLLLMSDLTEHRFELLPIGKIRIIMKYIVHIRILCYTKTFLFQNRKNC